MTLAQFAWLTAALAGVAIVGIAGWLAWPNQRPPIHIGASVDWSPKEETEATAVGFTDLELLPREQPVALDDGTIIGHRDGPAWAAIATDTHHVVDVSLEVALATFRQRMDGYAEQIATARPVVWWSTLDSTQQWNATELREAVNAS